MFHSIFLMILGMITLGLRHPPVCYTLLLLYYAEMLLLLLQELKQSKTLIPSNWVALTTASFLEQSPPSEAPAIRAASVSHAGIVDS
jgi:hypothetical protein